MPIWLRHSDAVSHCWAQWPRSPIVAVDVDSAHTPCAPPLDSEPLVTLHDDGLPMTHRFEHMRAYVVVALPIPMQSPAQLLVFCGDSVQLLPTGSPPLGMSTQVVENASHFRPIGQSESCEHMARQAATFVMSLTTEHARSLRARHLVARVLLPKVHVRRHQVSPSRP